MILLDTNVLVALVDQRDPARHRALDDLARLESKGLILTWPVVTESLHFLKRLDQRRYLLDLVDEFSISFLRPADEPAFDEVIRWMLQYDDHNPDLADAYLVLTTRKNARFRVWSYDREFAYIWRRPDGSAVPMAQLR